jgi:hypothetical protein
MNKEIANILKSFIEPLPFVDTLAGLVQTIEFASLEDKEKGKIIRFPASVDSNTTPTGKAWQYADLVPNSSKKSVIYFEDRGLKTTGKNRFGIGFESELRLVCWMNSDDPLPLVSIINALSDGVFNEAPITGIKITLGNILGLEDKIFGKYSYEESVNQFLMFPFSAFAIDLKINFNVSTSCL